MAQYVIFGTSHECQLESAVEERVIKLAELHAPAVIAEEFPFPGVPSAVSRAAAGTRVSYCQVDPPPHELPRDVARGLELRQRTFPDPDVRLSHADAVREEIWLDRIEAAAGDARVLLVCGYLHAPYLAELARSRGGAVLETVFFPGGLAHRTPERTLSPAELEKIAAEGGAFGAPGPAT